MPPDAQEKPLNPRHEAFCQYFVLGGNATYAARAAGYAPPSCKNHGYRLMRAALAAQAPAKTTNDDFPAPVAAAKVAKTTGYGEKAAGNDDFRTTR